MINRKAHRLRIEQVTRVSGLRRGGTCACHDGLVDERVRQLRSILERLSILLDEHEEAHWADWARRCAQSVSLLEPDSFKRVTGAYGGMGSLSDVMVWPPSGELTLDYAPAAEFERLRGETYRLAAQIFADIRASSS